MRKARNKPISSFRTKIYSDEIARQLALNDGVQTPLLKRLRPFFHIAAIRPKTSATYSSIEVSPPRFGNPEYAASLSMTSSFSIRRPSTVQVG